MRRSFLALAAAVAVWAWPRGVVNGVAAADGQWRLRVRDTAAGDAGAIDSWTLTAQ